MKAWIAALPLLLLMPSLARAQEPLPRLPDDVQERMSDMQADPEAVRIQGPVTIPADSTVGGPLVVEGGTLDLAGRIEGDLLIVRGDLVLRPGSAVTGDVLVIGGDIEGIESATVGGTLLAYGTATTLTDADRRDRRRDERERDEKDEADEDGDWRHRRRDRDDGGLDLGLSIAGNYNRVEGLPVMFGPVIRSAGPNRLQLSGQAIWRTEPSSSLDEEIGYLVRIDQGLFRDQLRIGGDVAARVLPIETHGLNSTEAGLAAALFHDDLHDYYEEQGWGVHVELRPAAFPIEATLGYRQAEHGLLEVSDPWSLFDGGDDWRLQPVVAQGDLSTLSFVVALDTRDDEDEPVRGILASLGIEHALDQDLVMPSIDLDGAVGAGLTFEDFTIARLDLRMHVPVNRSSTLNLRAFAAGTIEEAVLPPQFQRAFGGVGTLPGFGLFQGSCGSRASRVFLVTVDTAGTNVLSDEPMRPAYGCDRIVLGQLEYRGGFGFDSWDGETDGDTDEEWWEEIDDVDLHPDWAFFVDVAHGWSHGNMTFATRGDTETMVDVGLGLLLDELGVYAAMPVTGDDHSLRVVARLQRRF